MTTQQQNPAYFPARTDFINRKAEMALIDKAIASSKNEAIYFRAAGGIGKTRLLEEVLKRRANYRAQGVRCLDLIDLFHVENHTPDSVQFSIAEQLDPPFKIFHAYKELSIRYAEAEQRGDESQKMKDLAQQRDQQFLEDYQRLVEVNKERVLLIFDTTEQIQHESEAVQQLFGEKIEYLAIQDWLVNQAPKLPNTVILLAGRPKREIETQLRTGFKRRKWSYQERDLDALSLPDAIVYLDKMLLEHPLPLPLDTKAKEWLHKISAGKPIRLALAVQYIHSNGIVTLRASLAEYETNPSRLAEELDRILLEHLIDLRDDFQGAMNYMLVARNGMDRALLRRLTGWEDAKVEAYFSCMKGNILFKSRGVLLFLHDELYELYDKYFQGDPQTSRSYIQVADYYQELLQDASLKYEERVELRIKSLVYELHRHIEQGYFSFSRWDEEAIWLHFKSADYRFRDQMLAFTNRYLRSESKFYDRQIVEQVGAERVDTDSAIRCIEREISDTNYKEAIRKAETILRGEGTIFAERLKRDILYKARIQYAWCEAAVYQSNLERVDSTLEEIISVLQNLDAVTYEDKFWRLRTLGRAYNRLGYFYRLSGYYSKALTNYRKAVTSFRLSRLNYLLAQTLTNLGFILAQIGDSETALEQIKDARAIWGAFGKNFRMVMTLSTLSRILVEANQPIEALKELQKAEKIAQELEDLNSIRSLQIAQGRAYRKQGNLWKDGLALHSEEEAVDLLEKGENILVTAETSLNEQSSPLDQWEIANELGSLYCDWAWLYLHLGNRTAASTCYQRSIKYQKQALKVVRDRKMWFQTIDSLDDLAQARGDFAFLLLAEGHAGEGRNMLKEAMENLDEIEQDVPRNYKGESGASGPQEDGAPYWLALGKVFLWRGVWHFRLLAHEQRMSLEKYETEIVEATQNLLVSLMYFKNYGENVEQNKRTFRYLSHFMDEINPSYEWMDTQITNVEQKYNVKLTSIRTRMQNKLGF